MEAVGDVGGGQAGHLVTSLVDAPDVVELATARAQRRARLLAHLWPKPHLAKSIRIVSTLAFFHRRSPLIGLKRYLIGCGPTGDP